MSVRPRITLSAVLVGSVSLLVFACITTRAHVKASASLAEQWDGPRWMRDLGEELFERFADRRDVLWVARFEEWVDMDHRHEVPGLVKQFVQSVSLDDFIDALESAAGRPEADTLIECRFTYTDDGKAELGRCSPRQATRLCLPLLVSGEPRSSDGIIPFFNLGAGNRAPVIRELARIEGSATLAEPTRTLARVWRDVLERSQSCEMAHQRIHHTLRGERPPE